MKTNIASASLLLIAGINAKKKMFEAPVTLETKNHDEFDLANYYLNLADT